MMPVKGWEEELLALPLTLTELLPVVLVAAATAPSCCPPSFAARDTACRPAMSDWATAETGASASASAAAALASGEAAADGSICAPPAPERPATPAVAAAATVTPCACELADASEGCSLLSLFFTSPEEATRSISSSASLAGCWACTCCIQREEMERFLALPAAAEPEVAAAPPFAEEEDEEEEAEEEAGMPSSISRAERASTPLAAATFCSCSASAALAMAAAAAARASEPSACSSKAVSLSPSSNTAPPTPPAPAAAAPPREPSPMPSAREGTPSALLR